MKECTKCKNILPFNNFYKNNKTKDGYFYYCKLCIKDYNNKNKDKKIKYDKEYSQINSKKKSLKSKEYYENNKSKMKEYYKNYNKINKDKISIVKKIYDKNNLEKKKLYFINRRKHDPLFKLTCHCRTMINNSLKTKGYVKNNKSNGILGCSFEELKNHLESQFESWMNWDNYGNPKDGIYEPNKTWDIDHIIPISKATTEEDMLKLNHYSNLQPLCSYYNRFIKKNIYE